MIKVSSQAKEKVVQMMLSDGVDITSHFVRVGVKSGGCSGLSYELKFDADLGEDDKIFEDNDVRIVVNKKSFLYLVDTIDRTDTYCLSIVVNLKILLKLA